MRRSGLDGAPWRHRRGNYRNILQSGEDFVLRVNEWHQRTQLIPRALLRQYLQFSIRIRSGVDASSLPAMPIGYYTFARVFNEEEDNPHHLSTLNANGHWARTDYPEPEPSLFFGRHATEAEATPADPRIGEIGSWLLDRELWRNRRLREQREMRGRATMRGVRGAHYADDEDVGEEHDDRRRGNRARRSRNRPRGQQSKNRPTHGTSASPGEGSGSRYYQPRQDSAPLATFSPSAPTPTDLADDNNVEMGEFANDAGEVTEEAHPGESHNNALEEDAVLGEDFDQLDG